MTAEAKQLEAEALAARQAVHDWCAAYEEQHQVHPRRRQIFESPEGRRLFQQARELEKALAGPAPPGNCQHYLWRKRRWCRRQAAQGASFCSAHASAAAEEEPEWCRFGQDTSEERKLDAAPRKRKAQELALRQGPSESYVHPKRNLRRRLKRMSNPFAAQHRRDGPIDVNWADIYSDLSLPLLLDIGCAKGRFLQRLAKQEGESALPPHNYLGIELFGPLGKAQRTDAPCLARRSRRVVGCVATLVCTVEEALSWRDEFLPCPSNLHYVSGNALQLLGGLKSRLPNLQKVCIQFPDPWGGKHKKRRLVTKQFAELIAALLPSGGSVYVASDHQDVAEEIQDRLLATKAFVLENRRPDENRALDVEQVVDAGRDSERQSDKSCADEARWMPGGYPYGVPTERDDVCETEWRKVWRCILKRR